MEERIIDVKGKKLYIKYDFSFGERPTLIFLHDSLGCAQLWRDFPERLSEATKCNVLIYDRLGYGKSYPMPTYERPVNYMELEADLLSSLLTELNIDKAILFGHSDGGTIALITASKYREKVQAVICEAGHIFVEEVTLKGIYDALETYKTTNLAERLQKYHGDKVKTLFKAWTETWTREDYRTWNIEYLLKDIICPLLFIQGDADEYGSLEQVNRTINQVGGTSEKYIIPGAGHTPHKEMPDMIIEKSAAFIEEIS
ncbi:alpha/beta hydrolase [Chryseobacterium flavum]|uniref:Alpha/beta hydrolase n=1 Tax=Chryseobacterium flavum TaxID=415851 RepID=A0A3D9CGE5_9FLAO|nr:alpha/beta hydrolase [Chryseobacterium flavum]REC64816.1 alpha/beta hydrolase [Chryseobacterium flavum]